MSSFYREIVTLADTFMWEALSHFQKFAV